MTANYCPVQNPYRDINGECRSFDQLCLKRRDGIYCQNFLNICKQCPFSNISESFVEFYKRYGHISKLVIPNETKSETKFENVCQFSGLYILNAVILICNLILMGLVIFKICKQNQPVKRSSTQHSIRMSSERENIPLTQASNLTNIETKLQNLENNTKTIQNNLETIIKYVGNQNGKAKSTQGVSRQPSTLQSMDYLTDNVSNANNPSIESHHVYGENSDNDNSSNRFDSIIPSAPTDDL